jgi:hypothetical protein
MFSKAGADNNGLAPFAASFPAFPQAATAGKHRMRSFSVVLKIRQKPFDIPHPA